MSPIPSSRHPAHHRPLLVRIAAALTLLGPTGVVPQVRAGTGGEPLEAAFDWSVPARFGLDVRTMITGEAAPDNVLDFVVTFPQTWQTDEVRGSPEVNPGAWRVDLDARASRGAIARYVWSVDGQLTGDSDAPLFHLELPAEGSYIVTLSVHDASGGVSSVDREVLVQDWLIVGIGDSYASGEGNPEAGPTEWQDELLAAYLDLLDAEDDLQRALEDLVQARIELDLTLDEVRPALNALATYERECPSLSLDCAQATTRLIAELVKLGFGEAEDLLESGVGYVRRQINALTRAARAAVEAAQAARDAAQATVDGIEEKIELLFKEGAVWQTLPPPRSDRQAHRSSLSGQARAALEIERLDSKTSVTFVHLAYSGARIVSDEGSSGLVDDQIDQVRQLVGNREIDALMVSIGGNDAGFVKILTALTTTDSLCESVGERAFETCQELNCLGQPESFFIRCASACGRVGSSYESRCHEQVGAIGPFSPETAEQILAAGLAKLESEDRGYPRLARELHEELPDLQPARVYITEYPNLVEDDSGSICPQYATVSPEDWRWAGEEMTKPLNDKVREGAAAQGWTFVDGVFEAFRRHGYCADDHWVVKAEESFLNQGDSNGSAHPNEAGHLAYGRLLHARLQADLYEGGDLGHPRRPGSALSHLFRRGEVNDDGSVNIADAVLLLGHLYLGRAEPGCLDAADANDDGELGLDDVLEILRFLFRGGVPLPAPGAHVCGPAPEATASPLGCERQNACR